MRWRTLNGDYKSKLAEALTKPPHEVLGVPRECTKEEARRAYLDLVRTYHPDRSDPFMAGFNQEMLKIINAAYDRLSQGG